MRIDQSEHAETTCNDGNNQPLIPHEGLDWFFKFSRSQGLVIEEMARELIENFPMTINPIGPGITIRY